MLAGRAQLALRQNRVIGFRTHKYGMDAITACSCDPFMDDEFFVIVGMFLELVEKACVSHDMTAFGSIIYVFKQMLQLELGR